MRHEAKSACHFHIPNSGKGMLKEKSPNGDSLHLITLNKDIFIMLMWLLIHLTQIVLFFFLSETFSLDLNIVNKFHTCFLDGTVLW